MVVNFKRLSFNSFPDICTTPPHEKYFTFFRAFCKAPGRICLREKAFINGALNGAGNDCALNPGMMRKLLKSSRARSLAGRIGFTTMTALCIVFCHSARADQNVSLAWSASTDTNVMGYYLYCGETNGVYTSRIDVGLTTAATITGLTGRSVNYYFAATSYNAARTESMMTSPVQFTTSSNYSPALAPLPSVAGYVNTLLVVTNTVTDQNSSKPSLSFSLASGPSAMRIKSNNGTISWRPQLTDGGTTNLVSVKVLDNSTGLYDMQSFNVVISNAVQVTMSNVVVALGNTGVSPITVAASTPLTRLSFVLDAPSNRVSNLTVTSLIPGVATVTQSPAGAAHSTITITALSGQVLSGTQQVAQVSFVATANLISAFGVGAITPVSATAANGQPVPKEFGGNAQLVLVGAEPLAAPMALSNGVPCLVLYGPAGNTFQIQSSTTPMTPGTWTPYLTSGTLTANLTQIFTNVPTSTTPKYYRVLKL
jgi:hypothetical protein